MAHTAHIVLFGDSIFDNAAYVGGGPAVIDHLRRILPAGNKATLLAVDGAVTSDIPRQVRSTPDDATHLVVSMGGNDALGRSEILDTPSKSTADTFRMLARIIDEFENNYRQALTACLRKNLPVTVCTIYNGNFGDADYQLRVNVALATFDDAIVRIAREKQCSVIELRHVCTSREDYANPIEPSASGGAKIAESIKRTILDQRS
ncbi:MAG: SGNH/GDSL hydrolase family protein [Povalibacter sp.]|jgi:hypothetical protein